MYFLRFVQITLLLAVTKGSLPSPLAQSSGTPNSCYGPGIVAAVHGNSLTIKNDDGAKVDQVNQQTEITRGIKVSLSKVRVGDDVMLWCAGDGSLATDILVNFTHWGGTIIAIYPHRFVMFGKGRVGEAPGHVTVLLDGDANYDESRLKDLRVGRYVEVSSSILAPKRVQAAAVRIWPN